MMEVMKFSENEGAAEQLGGPGESKPNPTADEEDWQVIVLHKNATKRLLVMKYWISDTSSEAIALKISFSDRHFREIRNRNEAGWKCSKVDSVLGSGPKNRGCVTRTTTCSKTPISNLFLGLMRSALHHAGAQSTATLHPSVFNLIFR